MGIAIPSFIVIGCIVGIMTYQRYKIGIYYQDQIATLQYNKCYKQNDDSDSDDSKSTVTATNMVSDRTLSISRWHQQWHQWWRIILIFCLKTLMANLGIEKNKSENTV